MPENKKINCFLIGIQKAGTSSFYNWLSQHPEINAPEHMKDFHYFSNEKYLNKGINWLESFYSSDKNEPILLKGAINYFYDLKCPEKIKDYNPNSKFLLILRDPVKRAFSAYQYFKKLGIEKRTFDEAIKDELANKFDLSKPEYYFTYMANGFYYKQLLHWFQYFDRNNFFILNYENVFKSPQKALHDTFNFLNIDQEFVPELNTVNRTGKVKHKWLNNVFFSNKKLRVFYKNVLHLDKLVPLEKRILFLNRIRDWNTSKKGEAEKLNFETYSKLSLMYIEDKINLSNLLNTDFESLWQY